MPRLSYTIAEIAIRVRDLNKSRTFYTDVMGFDHHMTLENVVFLEIGPLNTPLGADHPQLLALFRKDLHLDQAHSTFDHIAFEVPAADYDAERATYDAKGMVIHEREHPETLPWRGRSFFFRDPDDNVIEIIAAKR